MTHTPGARHPARLLGLLLAGVLTAVLGTWVAPATEAAAATRTLKVLVMPVHWSSTRDTTASARKLISTDAGGWLSKASGKRLKLSTTVVSPTKITSGCRTTEQHAKQALAKKGYRLSRYDVVIFLAPSCAKHQREENAERTMSGRTTVVTLPAGAGRKLSTVLHQFGHVLGLEDARDMLCQKGRTGSRITLTIGTPSQCTQWFTTDDIAVMGGGSGVFSGPDLAQLGWLPSAQVITRVKGSATHTLYPLTSSRTRVIKIKANADVTYWLEYRTKAGMDASLAAAARGVQIRRDSKSDAKKYGLKSRPVLLDMLTTANGSDALRTGSTWTAPEGVRIAVGATSSTSARVTVTFRASKPQVPAAPKSRAVAGDEQITLTWSAPADRGRPIQYYEIEQKASGQPTYRPLPLSWERKTVLTAVNDLSTTIRLRAWNDLGPGAWATVRATPRIQRPTVAFVSPSAATVLAGSSVRLVVRATPHPASKAPITEVMIWGHPARRQADGTWAVTVDLKRLAVDGHRRITAIATDRERREGSAAVSVDIPQRLSAPQIVTPSSEPVDFPGPTLTLTVTPGVDRLGQFSMESVTVYFDWHFAAATAENGWTVTIPRSAATLNADDGYHRVHAVGNGPGGLTSYSAVVLVRMS